VELSPNTSIYQARQGYVLRTADDEHFELTLADRDVGQILDTLSGGSVPESLRARKALTALVDAGHVVAADRLPRVAVRGQGKIASATSIRLGGNSVDADGQADLVCHLSDDDVDPRQVGGADLISYRDGITQLITPRAVDVIHVIGRRRACVSHRDRIPPHHRPVEGGRRLDSMLHPVSDRAADLMSELVVAEIIKRQTSSSRRSDYLLTALDLRSLTVSRHPVLPIPVAPQ
jgi:hypothetical protein